MKKIIGKIFNKNRALAGLSFFIMALIAIPLAFAVNSQVNETPQLPISDFQIDKTEAKPGETIKGSFTIKNIETYTVNDISLLLGLTKIIKELEPSTNAEPNTYKYNDEEATPRAYELNNTLSIDSFVISQQVSLKAGASVQKEFEYKLPNNLSSGVHSINISAISGRGDIFGDSEGIKINVTNGANFLAITDEQLLGEDGKGLELSNYIGKVFDKKVGPRIKFKIKNYGGQVVARPQFYVYKRSVDERNFVLKKEENEMTFKENEEKDIELLLPAFDKPMIYLAELRFLDEKGDRVSNKSPFRWAIRGIGSQVLTLSTDKNGYKKGETVEISYETAGSGDLEEENEKGNLNIEIVDTKGRSAGTSTESISLDGISGKSNIKLTRAANGYTIKAKIVKGSEELDSYEVKISGEEEKAGVPFYLLGLLLGVVLTGGGVILFKNKGKRIVKPAAMLLLIAGVSLVSPPKVFAEQTVFKQAAKGVSFTWTSPSVTVKNQGENINVKGSVRLTECNNNFANQIADVYFAKSNATLDAGYTTTDAYNDAESDGKLNTMLGVSNIPMGAAAIGQSSTNNSTAYELNWTVPNNLTSDWVGRDDTWIMVFFRGDHIKTTGDANGNGRYDYAAEVEARYRLVYRQRMKILNKAPGATHITPADNAVFSAGTGITLTGQGSDPAYDYNPVQVQMRYSGDGGASWTTSAYSALNGQPYSSAWYIGTPAVGSYLWGVQAKDSYGAESGWTGNRAFRVDPVYTLTVSVSGDGGGTITGGGINCSYNGASTSGTCSVGGIVHGTNISLSAAASSGSVFGSWGGAGQNFTMDGNKDVTASFRIPVLSCRLDAVPPSGASGTLPFSVAFTVTQTDDENSFSGEEFRIVTDNTIEVKGWNGTNTASYTYTTSGPHTADGFIRAIEHPEPVPCDNNSVSFTVNPWSGGDQNEVAP